MTKKLSSLVLFQHDNLSYLTKHPERVINNLLSRFSSEETDKYPGYARWDGDGLPGIQIILTEKVENLDELFHLLAKKLHYKVKKQYDKKD